MNIIVVGCGKIGTTIVENLASEGHDLVVVDNNSDIVNTLTNTYDVIGVCGNGADYDTLEEAKANKAQLVIATTESDELNMLCCFIAKRMGAENTIARIRKPEYNDNNLTFMRKELEISVAINPDLLAARELFNILRLPSGAKVETFSSRNFELIELKLKDDSPLDGKKLCELRSKFKANFLVCAVQRGDDVYIPDGNFILKSGDKVCFTALATEIIKFFKEINIQYSQARNVMIIGGSRIAVYLAKMLTTIGNNVTIIEKDTKTCEELCEALPKVMVINADGTQQDLLLEEGLVTADAFVALTGMDEQNILLSGFAAKENVPKVVAKINREELIPMAEHLGIECIVSPKKIVSNKFVQYARALENSTGSSVETLYKVMDNNVEALEFRVMSDFPKLQIPFKTLKTKPNTLIAGIVRGKKVIVPSGEDMFCADDKVIVLAAGQRINKLTDILEQGQKYE